MVTLQDVAHAAGVSIATASWAVNDSKDVRIPEETKKRVGRIAKSGVTGGMPWRGAWHGVVRLDRVISDGTATSPFIGQVIHGAQASWSPVCFLRPGDLFIPLTDCLARVVAIPWTACAEQEPHSACAIRGFCESRADYQLQTVSLVRVVSASIRLAAN